MLQRKTGRHNAWRALGFVSVIALATSCGEKPTDAGAPPASDLIERVDTSPKATVSVNERFLEMMERHAAQMLKMDPLGATALGVSESIGGVGYLSRLPDYSILAREDAMALNDKIFGDLRQIDPAALSGTAARTYQVMANAYETAARRNQFRFGRGAIASSTSPYVMHQLDGPHLRIPRTLLTQHPLTTPAEAEAYVSRLEKFGSTLYDTEDSLRLDAESGTVPPIFALNGAAKSIDNFMASAPADHVLVTSFATKIASIDDLTPETRSELVSRAVSAVGSDAYPALESLAATLRSLISAAGSDAGVWRLDEGAAFYQHALNGYGASGRTADQIHDLGLSEVARISAEMNVLFNQIGTPQAATAGERFALLAKDPAQIYPNTDESKEILLAELRAQVAAINKIAPDWFASLPAQDVEVRRIPVYEQDTAPGGYYTSPSLDGTRPGIYWINLKNTADWPKYTLKTLTYHEAVPGHHFQIALQQAIVDMPLVRNLLFYSEFGEGWALYGEKVAAEMGMYADDPLGDLGRLQSELFRAARLVVDTGLHHKRWTREQAIDWMVTNTGETRDAVTREVERYSVWPGQATSYKLGALKIDELRARAEATLGDQFDIRTFHDAVLLEGSMPLQVLEAKIDAWISSQADE